MAKVRLDTLVHHRGLVGSREKARAMIMAGEVTVDGKLVLKPGSPVDDNAEIGIKSRRQKYVSRGGYKLEGAIQDFDLDFTGKVVLDIGASTGGYSDCALQNGAARVFALDVGYGQLDWTLRNDSRVTVIERANIRYFDPAQLGGPVDIITMDVSFISTRLIFPVLTDMLKDGGEVVSLIKPQFEAGKDKVGKHGVVRDARVHLAVLQQCIEAAARAGLGCLGVTFSSIKGPKGNIEYFIYLQKGAQNGGITTDQIEEMVQRANSTLGGKTLFEDHDSQ
ncbi:MAG: TlyA family RNA methyltransferase [Syntrophomonadaceae bacterium]|nr:TlyA family RNA methyltransferase [Syntrophomonadaceae bacterium]